jgi:BirA family biotin operon repressor/biotin-[acetyl-CoA-carboxylase] ligase
VNKGHIPEVSWEGCSETRLAAHWLLPAVHLHSVAGSTNDLARRLAVAGAPTGTLVLAEEQRAGRGRGLNAWSSPPGVGLWASLVVRGLTPTDVGLLPIRVAVAVADALDPWAGDRLRVKWPNDLIIDDRKLGGILCEASWEGHRLDHVIVGIGVNLLQAPNEFPDALRDSATSLRAAIGRSLSRFDVATALLGALRPLVIDPILADPEDLVKRFAGRDHLRGRMVEIRDAGTGRLLAAGRARSIDVDGGLLIESRDGFDIVRSGTVRIL